MCGGLEYEYIDKTTGKKARKKVYFPIPHAQIPVETEAGIELMQWGKRQGEDPEFNVPITGWARLASLAEGKWNQYQPNRVKIPALRWMEKDKERVSHWFDMEPGGSLLGVKIEKPAKDDPKNRQTFVYIVTHPAKAYFAQVHDRMPYVVH